MEIPFRISIIAAVLKVAGHDVDLFVVSPVTPFRKILKVSAFYNQKNI
jgi:hypothetical protein